MHYIYTINTLCYTIYTTCTNTSVRSVYVHIASWVCPFIQVRICQLRNLRGSIWDGNFEVLIVLKGIEIRI